MFPLTAIAIAALDAHATYEGAHDESSFVAKHERLVAAVGHAFATDTVQFNRAELCHDRCRHPGGREWVRDIVSRFP